MNVETIMVIGFILGCCFTYIIFAGIFGDIMKLNYTQIKKLREGVKKCES